MTKRSFTKQRSLVVGAESETSGPTRRKGIVWRLLDKGLLPSTGTIGSQRHAAQCQSRGREPTRRATP